MTQFSFPFKGKRNTELLDEQVLHALLRDQPSGNWLVSRDGWWHGGVHFTSSSGSEVDMAAGVRCIADGEVVAYRLNKAPLSTTVTDQTGSKAAPYSTGFVLVRHQLAAPKPKTPPTPASQRTNTTPATARPAEPPPKPLVFFSLYMHLQSLEEYQTNDARHPSAKQPRPAFWQRVYAVSDSANNRPRQQPGRTPCGASVYKTATPGSRLGILPVGTELLVRGSPRHHLVRIAEILGEAAALPDTRGHAPDPLIAQGWIDQRLLTPVDTPNARSLLDEVVILSEPYPIKAGELVGHLGLYHWHSQPDSVNRMLHLEVFCGDELPGFIQTSRTVAARLPRDSCTILKTGLGAVLWERHTSTVADTQIPANTRLTAPTNDKHTDTAWIQVSAAGQSYWISRQDWGGIQQHGNKTSSNVAAWRSYPDSFKAPVNPLTLTTGVDHYRALSWLEQHKAELGARDQDGNRWWKVHSALRTTTGFTDIEGWVKAVLHPGGNVTSEHPGDWVDFQLEASDEGGTGTLFADRQQFKDYLGNPRGGMGSKDKLAPLFQQLHGFMTRGGDGSSAANDLRQAASSRWIAARLARAIARHDSEWSSNSLAKWKELKRVLQTPENAGLWEQELVRIEKLAWWEQVSGKVADFPGSSKVYHLHPVVFIGNNTRAHPIVVINGIEVELEFLNKYSGEIIEESDFEQAAINLTCEVAAIKAVAITETGGSGSYFNFENWDAVPSILFERHYFHAETSGFYDKDNPTISNKTPGGYGVYSSQYEKLCKAYSLNKSASLKSASWGKFQIMGKNFAGCGFSSVEEFVLSISVSEKNHLLAFVNHIKNNKVLLDSIQKKQWLTFAINYNGEKQKGYDKKMEENYNEIKNK